MADPVIYPSLRVSGYSQSTSAQKKIEDKYGFKFDLEGQSFTYYFGKDSNSSVPWAFQKHIQNTLGNSRYSGKYNLPEVLAGLKGRKVSWAKIDTYLHKQGYINVDVRGQKESLDPVADEQVIEALLLASGLDSTQFEATGLGKSLGELKALLEKPGVTAVEIEANPAYKAYTRASYKLESLSEANQKIIQEAQAKIAGTPEGKARKAIAEATTVGELAVIYNAQQATIDGNENLKAQLGQKAIELIQTDGTAQRADVDKLYNFIKAQLGERSLVSFKEKADSLEDIIVVEKADGDGKRPFTGEFLASKGWDGYYVVQDGPDWVVKNGSDGDKVVAGAIAEPYAPLPEPAEPAGPPHEPEEPAAPPRPAPAVARDNISKMLLGLSTDSSPWIAALESGDKITPAEAKDLGIDPGSALYRAIKDGKITQKEWKALGLTARSFDIVNKNMNVNGTPEDTVLDLTELAVAGKVIQKYGDTYLSHLDEAQRFERSKELYLKKEGMTFENRNFRVAKQTAQKLESGALSGIDFGKVTDAASLKEALKGKVSQGVIDTVVAYYSGITDFDFTSLTLTSLSYLLVSINEASKYEKAIQESLFELNLDASLTSYKPKKDTVSARLTWLGGKASEAVEGEEDAAGGDLTGVAKLQQEFVKFRDKYFNISGSGTSTTITFKDASKKEEAMTELKEIFDKYLALSTDSSSEDERAQASGMLMGLYTLFIPKIDPANKGKNQAELTGKIETAWAANQENLELGSTLLTLLSSEYEGVRKALPHATGPSEPLLEARKKKLSESIIKIGKKLLEKYQEKLDRAGTDTDALTTYGAKKDQVLALLSTLLLPKIGAKATERAEFDATLATLKDLVPYMSDNMKNTLIYQLNASALSLKQPGDGDVPPTKADYEKAIILLEYAIKLIGDKETVAATVPAPTAANPTATKTETLKKADIIKTKESAVRTLATFREDGSSAPARSATRKKKKKKAAAVTDSPLPNGDAAATAIRKGKQQINAAARTVDRAPNAGAKAAANSGLRTKIDTILSGLNAEQRAKALKALREHLATQSAEAKKWLKLPPS